MYFDAVLDALREFADVRDDADGAAFLAQALDGVDHRLERVRVERAEAFVEEEAFERGAGAGLGTNLNIPLPIGTGDDGYMQAMEVARKAVAAFAPGALVIALGLDASEHDPLRGLAVTTAGFRRIGQAIARMGLPTVFVQEGGYLSDILGANLTSVLAGFEEAR